MPGPPRDLTKTRIDVGGGAGDALRWLFKVVFRSRLGRRRAGPGAINRGHAVDWIIGVIAVIALVIATSTMWRMSNAQAQLTKKLDVSLRAALGALKVDADENAALLKRMSDRILDLERRHENAHHSKANKEAELAKLRAENKRLRSKPMNQGKNRKIKSG